MDPEIPGSWLQRHPVATAVAVLAAMGATATLVRPLVRAGIPPSPAKLSSPPLFQLGDPPLGVAKGRAAGTFVCLKPIRAFAENRLFFPPGHPRSPSDAVRPSRCFSSAEEARTSGYRRAPLPPGWEDLGGIFLAPATSYQSTRCRDAAGALGFPVPCPTLVPSWGDDLGCPRAEPGGCVTSGSFVMRGSFIVVDPRSGRYHPPALIAISAIPQVRESITCGIPTDQIGVLTANGYVDRVLCSDASWFAAVYRWSGGGIHYEVRGDFQHASGAAGGRHALEHAVLSVVERIATRTVMIGPASA